MAGGYYTALSGMRTRMDALDRLASDIANAGTTGFKPERAGTTEARRPSFDAALEAAVDVANGRPRIDLRPGALAPTGRSLDIAIEGKGFLVVDTPRGVRYTRNGHLARRADGVLAGEDGAAVQGANGPIRLGDGAPTIDADGTVRSGGAVVGRLRLVDFDPKAELLRDAGSTFRTDAKPLPVANPVVTSGSLEQSNVSIVERVAELTDVSQGFQALLKAVSVLMNDVDRGAINELGRR
jgi:flagellar basal body rod protein FlgG